MYQLRGAESSPNRPRSLTFDRLRLLGLRPTAAAATAAAARRRQRLPYQSLNDFNRLPTRSLPRVVSDASETYYRHVVVIITTKMWADAQRDGRPAEYRWRRMLNAAKFGSRPLFECRAEALPI